MKHLALVLPLFLSILNPAVAGSIPREEISADAKWLIQLDAAQFRATKVGGFITTEMLERNQPAVQKLNTKFKLNIDVNKIVEGITLYGTDYDSPQDHAVLLIRASPDFEKIAVGFLAGMALAGTNAPVRVTQTQQGALAFYDIQDAAYCAILPGRVIAIGRSREVTEQAAIGGFGDMKEAFFFLGVAQGFNLGNNLPPQAKLLQAADAGRIALGENANLLFLNLALRSKSPEVVTQMQQAVQGLIAIGSLSQPQSIKVSTDANVVNISVDYPVDRAIDQLTKVRDQMIRKQHAEPAPAENETSNATPATAPAVLPATN